MPGSYTADEQTAAKLAGAIADSPGKLAAGNSATQSTTTATTTAVVTHGLGSTPDFCIAQRSKADVAAPAWAANSTTLTFTVTSATGFYISYIAGYTA
jgi:hypothetical protein